MQSVVDAENSQVPIQSNNGLVGPPEYVAPQAQLNYNRPQEFTREQVFGNLNFGSQPKIMKSVQRAKVPTFTKATTLAEASTKASNKGSGTFIHNNKLYTTEPKTYRGKDLKEVVVKARRLNQNINLSKSPFAFNGNTVSQDKLQKSDPQGYLSKGWEILNNPVEAFGYGARNQRIPDHFSSGPKGRNAYDMALEIPKLGIPIGQALAYGKGLVNQNTIKLANTITQKAATQLPKLVKNPGAMQAQITGYLNTLKKIGTMESNQILNSIQNAAKNPTQLKKLVKMLNQTHLMNLQ